MVNYEEKYNNLLQECSENTVISSMNDMKIAYAKIESDLEKARMVNLKYISVIKCTMLMINRVVEDSEQLIYSDQENNLFTLKMRLEFIHDILKDNQYVF